MRVKNVNILNSILLCAIITIGGFKLFFQCNENIEKGQKNKGDNQSFKANPQIAYQNEMEHKLTVTAKPEKLTYIESTNTNKEEIETRIKHQQERLQTIEMRANQKRKQIEECYSRRLKELETRKNATLTSIESQAWAKYNQKLKHKTATTEESISTESYVTTNGYLIGYGKSEKKCETNVVGNPAREYADKQQQLTKIKNDSLAEYNQELINIENKRQYDLTQIDKWEKLQKSYVYCAIRDIKEESKPEIRGLVTGIMYSKNSPSAIIGHRKIIHEGDTIYGVKVIEIYKDKILFKKDNTSWTQSIQESPAPYWTQNKKSNL